MYPFEDGIIEAGHKEETAHKQQIDAPLYDQTHNGRDQY
jgi:hypothetical protein